VERDLDAIWDGEWGWPIHCCIRWESACPEGKGDFGGFSFPLV